MTSVFVTGGILLLLIALNILEILFRSGVDEETIGLTASSVELRMTDVEIEVIDQHLKGLS